MILSEIVYGELTRFSDGKMLYPSNRNTTTYCLQIL